MPEAKHQVHILLTQAAGPTSEDLQLAGGGQTRASGPRVPEAKHQVHILLTQAAGITSEDLQLGGGANTSLRT